MCCHVVINLCSQCFWICYRRSLPSTFGEGSIGRTCASFVTRTRLSSRIGRRHLQAINREWALDANRHQRPPPMLDVGSIEVYIVEQWCKSTWMSYDAQSWLYRSLCSSTMQMFNMHVEAVFFEVSHRRWRETSLGNHLQWHNILKKIGNLTHV